MPKRESLADFASYDEARQRLDSHSTANLYARPVKFTVASDLQIVIVNTKNQPIERISVKKQLGRQIQKIARHDKVTPQQLVQSWLQEKIQERLHLSSL